MTQSRLQRKKYIALGQKNGVVTKDLARIVRMRILSYNARTKDALKAIGAEAFACTSY